MIRAFILDLDNTVFATDSIADKLFVPFYKFLAQHADEIGEDNIPEIKKLMLKKAWQKIADQFDLNENLVKEGSDILRGLKCDFPMHTFEDYEHVKPFKVDKFLVTMGFTDMQQSKIKMLDLESDFKETSVNDPEKTDDTKKEVFEGILKKYGYKAEEVLVIGDDPDSEIKAGLDLGIPTVLYDVNDEYKEAKSTHHIKGYTELEAIVNSYNS
jgi:putative hydrolase of the HAD superfamily